MAWSQSLTETTAENSGELGSSKAVLGLDAKQWKDRETVSAGSRTTNQSLVSATIITLNDEGKQGQEAVPNETGGSTHQLRAMQETEQGAK